MIAMANEVSFFHAMRIVTFEEDLEKRTRLLEMIEMSKDQWDYNPFYRKVYEELQEDIEKTKRTLEEAKKDLEEAKKNHE